MKSKNNYYAKHKKYVYILTVINSKNYNRIEKDEYVTCYLLNDKLHRLDGPAKEFVNGDKSWYQNGLCHRIDGPAVEFSNGDKLWLQNGLLHRLDGPAMEYSDGSKAWWFEGKRIDCKSQEEFERFIKMRLFW